jgi:hypothetical protein
MGHEPVGIASLRIPPAAYGNGGLPLSQLKNHMPGNGQICQAHHEHRPHRRFLIVTGQTLSGMTCNRDAKAVRADGVRVGVWGKAPISINPAPIGDDL